MPFQQVYVEFIKLTYFVALSKKLMPSMYFRIKISEECLYGDIDKPDKGQ